VDAIDGELLRGTDSKAVASDFPDGVGIHAGGGRQLLEHAGDREGVEVVRTARLG
jgi:hypothetical protein